MHYPLKELKGTFLKIVDARSKTKAYRMRCIQVLVDGTRVGPD